MSGNKNERENLNQLFGEIHKLRYDVERKYRGEEATKRDMEKRWSVPPAQLREDGDGNEDLPQEGQRRGLDVIPQDDKGKCGAIMVARRIWPALLTTILCIFGAVALIGSLHYSGLWIAIGLLDIFFLYLEIHNLRLLFCFMFGRFDMFGGYITHIGKRRRANPAYLRDNGRFEYGTPKNKKYNKYHYADVNGVSVRIDEKQKYQLLGGHYFYVLRIKAKYIDNDDYFFIKADPSLESRRTGEHFPKDEPREYHTPRSSNAAGYSIGLGIMLFVVATVLGLALPKGLENTMIETLAKFWWAFDILGIILIIAGGSYNKKFKDKHRRVKK